MVSTKASLPALVPFPPRDVRQQLPPEIWLSCLDAWQSLLRTYLALDLERFENCLVSQPTLGSFLSNHLEELARGGNDESLERAGLLRQDAYRLTCRALLDCKSPPKSLLQWDFLATLCTVYRGSNDPPRLCREAWQKHTAPFTKSLTGYRDELSGSLDSGKSTAIDQDRLQRLIHLSRCCPPAVKVFVIGTDFLDSVIAAYTKLSVELQSKLVVLLYFGLASPLYDTEPNVALFIDQLYSLRRTAAKTGSSSTGEDDSVIAELVFNTPILAKAELYGVGSGSGRGRDIITSLGKLRKSPKSKAPHLRPRRRTKHRQVEQTDDSMHIHRFSSITQIQDLFPHLGFAYIARLLDELENDAEQVIARLLDGSLPPHLQDPNNTEGNDPQPTSNLDRQPKTTPDLVPKSHPFPPQLPERRNVFDNDAFDNLTISPSQIHKGRKERPNTTASKAAILSALAAFSPDDDERDDTYDLADVGGTVDTSRPGGVEDTSIEAADLHDKNEEALFRAFGATPTVFERDVATRRGQGRRALKEETGMTDEGVEGWAIMLRRDARRLRALEAKYATFNGAQTQLSATRWQESSGAEESEHSGAEGAAGPSARGGSRGGSRGRGRGRGRETTASADGPSNQKSTQFARNRNEASKGSRANHNRRDQRARKVARAGFPG